MGCFHKALPNVKSAYVTLQNFTPDLQKIYTDISAVSVTLCNSGCWVISLLTFQPFKIWQLFDSRLQLNKLALHVELQMLNVDPSILVYKFHSYQFMGETIISSEHHWELGGLFTHSMSDVIYISFRCWKIVIRDLVYFTEALICTFTGWELICTARRS